MADDVRLVVQNPASLTAYEGMFADAINAAGATPAPKAATSNDAIAGEIGFCIPDGIGDAAAQVAICEAASIPGVVAERDLITAWGLGTGNQAFGGRNVAILKPGSPLAAGL